MVAFVPSIPAPDESPEFRSAQIFGPSPSLMAMRWYSFDLQLPPLTASFSDPQGVLSLELPALEVTFQAGEEYVVSLAIPELALTLNGVAGESWELDVRVPELTAAFYGPNSLALVLAAPTLNFAAIAGESASLDLVVPAPVVSLTGSFAQASILNIVLPELAVAFSFSNAGTAQLALELPALQVLLRGISSVPASLALELPPLTLSLGLVQFATLQLEIIIPPLRMEFTATSQILEQYAAWATNTKLGAVTDYSAFEFNSFARVGTKLLAAGPSGLFLLAGDDDAGSTIDWKLRTGFFDSGGPLVRTPSIFVSARTTQAIRVKVWPNEDIAYEYTLPTNGRESFFQRRVKAGKGMKSRYYRIELASMNGGLFDLASLEFEDFGTTRRVG